MKRGFFQVGIVILIASLFVGTFLIKNLNIKNSEAGTQAPPSCSTYEFKDSGYTCGSIDRSESGACGRDPATKCVGKEFCRAYRNERRCNGNGKYGQFTNVHCCEGTDYTCALVSGKCGYAEKTPSPKPTESPSPTPVITQSPTPKPTNSPKPTKTPVITKSPSPTPTNSTSPSPSLSPVSKLVVCKYKDENGNGYKDSEDHLISWNFKYEIDGTVKDVNSYSWNVFKKGCVAVTVPNEKTIKVSEYGRNGWDESGLYADGARQSTWDYSYTSAMGQTKEIWFLNNERREGEPNNCNGTCGSNSNCKSEFYCYKGYCRNPRNPESKSCSEPTVLSATAPPELPKTGNNMIINLFGMTSLAGIGIYLYRKFKLV